MTTLLKLCHTVTILLVKVVKALTSRYLSPQMDESTQRDGKVVLIACARYTDKGEFAKEMVCCKSLETTTSSADTYGTLMNYSHVNNIPI